MSEHEDIVDKVEHLIDLATQNSETNEARTAAVKACRLIRLHKLTISESWETRRRGVDVEQDPVAQAGRFLGEVLGGMARGHAQRKRRRT